MFWRPESDPRTVILTDAPTLGASTLRFDPPGWRGDYDEQRDGDGVHALFSRDGGAYRLWMPHPIAHGASVASVLPLDPGANWRASAALQFWRHIVQGRAPDLRADARLKRAHLSLLALDDRRAGASYRAVAERVYGAARVAAESWRTSSLRDATIRLVRSGSALVAGDYRRLLRPMKDD